MFFLYNNSVIKVPGEDMDLTNFQNSLTIWIYILINRDIVLNLAWTQDFHPFLDLAWTQDFAQGNLESWLTTICFEQFLESWLTLIFQKHKSWILLDCVLLPSFRPYLYLCWHLINSTLSGLVTNNLLPEVSLQHVIMSSIEGRTIVSDENFGIAMSGEDLIKGSYIGLPRCPCDQLHL